MDMSSVVYSDEQEAAFATIKKWWNGGRPEHQEFLLFGFAGVGKTTLAKALPELLDLKMYEEPDTDGMDKQEKEDAKAHAAAGALLYCAFTGKAASVLRRKGITAYTIHQSIYGRPLVDESKINLLMSKIAQQETAGDPNIASSIRELKRLLQPSFGLKSIDAKASGCSLILVDECSMIDEKLYFDLLQFGIPVIFTGDPAQLPPIGKSAGLIERTPNVLLTHIHRQAKDNPILELATHLRTSSVLPKINLPELVVTNQVFKPDEIAGFSQVIVGYHTTRRRLNDGMRKHFGFGEFPAGGDEKLINLKNDHQLKIMNGEMVGMTDFVNDGTPNFFLGKIVDFETKDALGEKFGTTQMIYDGYFKDCANFREGRIDRDWKDRAKATELDWGYAITCHKSQGSEWDEVFIHDDGFGRSELDRRRWLYTALTRARSVAMISSRFAQ